MKLAQSQKSRINKWVKKWKKELFLDQWKIYVKYHDFNEKEDVPASCNPDSDYMFIDIHVYKSFWSFSLKEQESFIVHELCHCITESIASNSFDLLNGNLVTSRQLTKTIENLTQRIANIAFPGGLN
ncbi:MAG: hypothetical protein Unbinned5081contig1003_5 [Prokaryotic dsDNA virus sp.]|nr:MAG: hypothetical protein Unbinned5081contig1003_5 [Prokaryotic dsDNA virus sp.]|tara:strand:- start:17375 stop:17755 length:381 start_codon:yes stop_codon:yes gene_type:complete